jgi:hypothetical protein
MMEDSALRAANVEENNIAGLFFLPNSSPNKGSLRGIPEDWWEIVSYTPRFRSHLPF